MTNCNCCRPNRFSRILRSKVRHQLCCIADLVDRLESSLNQDSIDMATVVSPGTRAAAQELFNYLISNNGCTVFLYNDPETQAPPQLVTETADRDTRARYYGVGLYVDCICDKIPFQVKSVVVGNQEVPNHLSDLADSNTTYGTSSNESTVAEYLEALCCLKNHYAEIKHYLENE